MRDPQKEAEDYLEKHKIIRVFEEMTSVLLYEKPEDPKQFLVDFLECVKIGDISQFIDRRDFGAMFGMFDITRKGVVTVKQANNALKTIIGQSDQEKLEEAGSKDEDVEMSKEEFVNYMLRRLETVNPFGSK
eukprot:TRINITY_DN31987_c0_g1_i2.p3 TRINITY_DN31987_c0_g1~~TRINITY_DN31987_c0_g1_i2.p3  ORF type:complete len:132 (+),score=21.06 TRINITY_DN31987_c0_g1_i2:315-710(+)